jgi:hypothetical protein
MEDELAQQFNEMSIHNVETDINTITASIKGMSFHMEKANGGNLTEEQNKLMNMYAKIIVTCKNQLSFIENSLRSPGQAKKGCSILFSSPTKKDKNPILETFASPLSISSFSTTSSKERILFLKIVSDNKRSMWNEYAEFTKTEENEGNLTKTKVNDFWEEPSDKFSITYIAGVENKGKENEAIIHTDVSLDTAKIVSIYNTYFPHLGEDGAMAKSLKQVYNPFLDISNIDAEKKKKIIGKNKIEKSEDELRMQTVEEFEMFLNSTYNKNNLIERLDCFYEHLITGTNPCPIVIQQVSIPTTPSPKKQNKGRSASKKTVSE